MHQLCPSNGSGLQHTGREGARAGRTYARAKEQQVWEEVSTPNSKHPRGWREGKRGSRCLALQCIGSLLPQVIAFVLIDQGGKHWGGGGHSPFTLLTIYKRAIYHKQFMHFMMMRFSL